VNEGSPTGWKGGVDEGRKKKKPRRRQASSDEMVEFLEGEVGPPPVVENVSKGT